MNSNNLTFIYAIKSLYFFASGQLSITEIKQSDMMICDPPKKQMFRNVSYVKSLQISAAVGVLNFGRFYFSIATGAFAVIIANWSNIGVLWRMCWKGEPLMCRGHV